MPFGSKWTPKSVLNNDSNSVYGAKQRIYLETADYSALNCCMHMNNLPFIKMVILYISSSNGGHAWPAGSPHVSVWAVPVPDASQQNYKSSTTKTEPGSHRALALHV